MSRSKKESLSKSRKNLGYLKLKVSKAVDEFMKNSDVKKIKSVSKEYIKAYLTQAFLEGCTTKSKLNRNDTAEDLARLAATTLFITIIDNYNLEKFKCAGLVDEFIQCFESID